MPILEIEIVASSDKVLADNLASRIADQAGKVFDTAPGHTWVKLRTLPYENYAENDVNPTNNPLPVFVTILTSQLPEQVDMAREVNALTAAIANICERSPDNVHILYLPSAAGRIAFGGRIIPD